MAKVTPFPAAPDAEPRVRGVFLVQPYKDGWIARAWPRRRGAPTNPYDRTRQAEFGYAARWASSPLSIELQSAELLVKESSFVPRDLLVRAIYGTAVEIQLEDGTELVPGRQVTSNPQYILDLLGDEPGSMIWRRADGWMLIPPGNPGQVLTNVNGIPEWANSGAPAPPLPGEVAGFIAGYAAEATGSSWPLNSCNIGAAHPDRVLAIAVVAGQSGGSPQTINGLTVNGVAATQRVQQQHGTDGIVTATYTIPLPLGSLGDIVINVSGTFVNLAIAIHRLIAPVTEAPSATAQQLTTSAGPNSLSLNITANGYCIYSYGEASGAGNCVLAGLDVTDYAPTLDVTRRRFFGTKSSASALTAHAISTDPTNTVRSVATACAWEIPELFA